MKEMLSFACRILEDVAALGVLNLQEAYFSRMSSGKFLNTLPLSWQICLTAILVGFLSSCNCQEAAILLIKHYCS